MKRINMELGYSHTDIINTDKRVH